MRKIKILAVAVLATGFLFTGCSKDDPKPTVTVSDFTATIAENPTMGQSIGVVNATVENSTNTGYYFTPEHTGIGEHITMNRATGELTVSDPDFFDYEQVTSISGTAAISAFDNNDNETITSFTVTINITDVNEVPPLTIQQRLDNGETPAQIIASGVDKTDLYGKLYGGGIIFYYSLVSNTGLLAAPTDQSVSLAWDFNTSGLVATGATSVVVGEGSINTSTIVSVLGTGSYAAQVCNDLTLGGYTDWFLPSKDVLGFMYTELHAKGLGSFQNTKYWSSTEFNTNSAWTRDFAVSSGQTFVTETKVIAHAVRAIRAF